jgi:TolA-binding protein
VKRALSLAIFLTILISGIARGEEVEVKEIQKLYDSAMYLYNEKEYELARTIFQQILQSYPESNLADNALYWRGISYYKEGKYDLALKEFERVLKEYPQGNKTKDAQVRTKKIRKILKREESRENKALKELIAELEKELSHKEYAEIP